MIQHCKYKFYFGLCHIFLKNPKKIRRAEKKRLPTKTFNPKKLDKKPTFNVYLQKV
jgi:hypothetical protein